MAFDINAFLTENEVGVAEEEPKSVTQSAAPAKQTGFDINAFLQENAVSATPTRIAEEQEPDQPFFALEDAVSAIGTIPEALSVGVPAAFQKLVTGTAMPEESEAMEKDIAFQERMRQEQQDRQAAGKSSMVGEAIREAAPSIATSFSGLGAGIAGAVGGTVVGGPVGGTVGGMAASGTASYRMAAADLLYRSFKALEEQKGSPLTEDEKAQAYKEFLPLAQNSALWEAGPEAVSNAVLLGAGKFVFGFGKPLARKLVGESIERVNKGIASKVAAGTGAVAAELGTETITALGQFAPEMAAQKYVKTGTTEGAPTEYPGGAMQAFKDVAPATLALTGMMAGAGGVAKAATLPFQKAKTPEQIAEDNINLDAEREADNLLIPDNDTESKSIKSQIDTERSDLAIKKELYNTLPDGDKTKAVLATEIKEYEGRITELDNTLRQRLGLSLPITTAEAEQARLAREIAAPPAEPAPAAKPTDEFMDKRNKDLFPDTTDFAGKLPTDVRINTYTEKDGIGTAEYVNPANGSTDVYISAFGDNDFIAYIRIYDDQGNPTNRFASKLERRTERAGASRSMIEELQSRLPANHEYTEDVSASTDGIRFISSQLQRGYDLVRDANGNVETNRIAINGESIVNDLGADVIRQGQEFADIQVTNKKTFDRVKGVVAPILEKFNAGLGENNIYWENGRVYVDIPVLRKAEPAPAVPVSETITEPEAPAITPAPVAETPAVAPTAEVAPKLERTSTGKEIIKQAEKGGVNLAELDLVESAIQQIDNPESSVIPESTTAEAVQYLQYTPEGTSVVSHLQKLSKSTDKRDAGIKRRTTAILEKITPTPAVSEGITPATPKLQREKADTDFASIDEITDIIQETSPKGTDKSESKRIATNFVKDYINESIDWVRDTFGSAPEKVGFDATQMKKWLKDAVSIRPVTEDEFTRGIIQKKGQLTKAGEDRGKIDVSVISPMESRMIALHEASHFLYHLDEDKQIPAKVLNSIKNKKLMPDKFPNPGKGIKERFADAFTNWAFTKMHPEYANEFPTVPQEFVSWIESEAISEPLDYISSRNKIRKQKPKLGEAGGVLIPSREDLIQAGQNIYEAGMEFATWARQMVSRFGDAVRQFLGDVWEAVSGFPAKLEEMAGYLPGKGERGAVTFGRGEEPPKKPVEPAPEKPITDPDTPDEQTQQLVQQAQEQESIVDAAVKEAGDDVFNVFNKLVNEGKTEDQVAKELGISNYDVRKYKLRADTAILNKMKQNKVKPLAFTPKNPVAEFAEKNLRKYFTKEGWLPKAVFQSWVKRNAALSREQKEAEFAIKDLYAGIREVFGISKMEMITKGLVSVPPDFVQQLNDALAGKIDINTMPEPVREPLTRMRQHIDAMSRQLVDLNVLPDELSAKISENLGVYLTRSYKIFTDKNWINKIPTEKLTAARNFLYQQQLKNDPEATIEMADRELRNMLNDWASDAEGLRKRGGKLGAKDLSVMMERAKVPKVLREVMGENTNVIFNYANTIGKISRFVSDQKFLNEVKAKGTGEFLFTEKDAPKGFNTQIAAEESRTMSPLNGLRTTPEIAKAFEEFGKGYDARENPGLYVLAWMNAVGKLNLTVGSVLTQMRNLLGQPAFFVFNGHYNWRVIRQEIDAIAKEKGISQEDAKKELVKLAAAQGLVNENAYAGELRTAFQEVGLETFDDIGPDEFTKQFVLTRMYLKGVKSAQELYQKTDEFGKLVGWLNETKRIQRMNKGMDKQTAQSIAAERTRDTYPTYSQSSEALRLFRRQPFVGPFATFFYETFRTSFHNLRYAFEDINGPTPEHKAEGIKRLAGAMTTLSMGAFGINILSKLASGIGDDEEEDVRRMLPPWAKDASLAWMPKSKDGTYNFINVSYINPYNAMTDPFIAMMSGFAKGDKPEEIAVQALGSFLSPFTSEQPVTATIGDAARNRTSTGKQIYNPQDDITTKTSKIMLHIFGKTFTPGTINRLRERIIPAIQGETVGTRAPAPEKEIAAELTGIRFETLDMKAAFSSKAWEFSRAANESERIFRDVATRRRRVDEQEQVDAYRRSEQTRYEIWNDMYRDYMAVRRAGASQGEAVRLMTDIGISKKEAIAISRGRYVPYEVSNEVLRRSKLNENKVPIKEIRAIGKEMPRVLTDITKTP